MVATRLEAFAQLGRAFRESARDFSDFAESAAVTDPEVLSYVNGVVRSMIRDRSLSVKNVAVNSDTFTGEVEARVNARLIKRFSFEISPDSKTFTPLNADEIEKFAEPLEFKVADGKTLKCKVAQCGGRCLKGGEKCRLTMKPEERKAHEAALRKVGTVDTSLAKKRREMKAARTPIKPSEVKTPADRLKLANQELAAARKKGDKRLISAWEKEAGLAQKAVNAASPLSSKKTTASGSGKVTKPTTQTDKKPPDKTKSVTPSSSKVHSVTKQQDFEDLVMHVHGKLAKEHDGLVPIYKLRREVGELVPRDKFNSWLKDMQTNDKLQFKGGSVEDSDPNKIKDSISTKLMGIRTYATLADKGEQSLAKASKQSKKLDETLKNRPELDPLGTASALAKGPKIKSQSDFDKVALDAHKRLNEEFNQGNLVPISDVRKALGDRVSKKDFDNHLLELQANDKVQLTGSDRAPKELQEGGVSIMGNSRVYMRKL